MGGNTPATLQTTVIISEMAFVVHLVRPTKASLFKDYAIMHLLPYLLNQMYTAATRFDNIFENYKLNSLRKLIWLKRMGDSYVRRRSVEPNIPIPKGKDWAEFLKVTENKEELFHYLATELLALTHDAEYEFITTKGDQALSNKPMDLSGISDTNHEEGDTRVILHLAHAVKAGHKKALIRTGDCDTVKLCVYHFSSLSGRGDSRVISAIDDIVASPAIVGRNAYAADGSGKVVSLKIENVSAHK